MSTVVKARIVKIGNSRGVRIPKVLLEQLHLGSEVEMVVDKDQLIIRPSSSLRQGWDEQFRTMSERGNDTLLDAPLPALTAWEDEEWVW
jgi:antitoxin MazE